MDRSGDELAPLPNTFSYSQARRSGISDRLLYRLRDDGVIQAVGRGLYRRVDPNQSIDIDLIEITRRAPRATLCLTTALARHDLTDHIPATIDVAIPRGRHRPSTAAPVTWHHFNAATFELGRSWLPLDAESSIGLYNAPRSIVDAFRFRGLEGPELGITALKRWLLRPGATASDLLAMARQFPRTEKALRNALEVLL